MPPNSPIVDYLLRLGDNCLVLGHRPGPRGELELDAVGITEVDRLHEDVGRGLGIFDEDRATVPVDGPVLDVADVDALGDETLAVLLKLVHRDVERDVVVRRDRRRGRREVGDLLARELREIGAHRVFEEGRR